MKSAVKFLLLFLTLCHYGYGDIAYKVINFKIPQAIWRQALHPTPVLKSPVTITVPINVQDNSNEVEDPVESDVPDLSSDVTEVVQDPVPVVNDPPAVTPSPPIQDVVASEAAPVPGQVIRFPCECRGGQCGCCTGALMERFRMKACGNITFIPEDFVFDVKLNVNNNTVVRQRVSASDPPPICFNPRRAPFVQVCAQISNIQIRNRNAHACFDINADIGGFPVYSASFRCFNFGVSGLQTGKKPRPVSSSGPKPVNLFGSSNNDDEGESLIDNVGETVFGEGGFFQGGGEGGFFQGGGGEGGSSEDGPFDGFGDAIGDFLDIDS